MNDNRGEYPADWEAIARGVKERADWRCIRCRHVHDAPSGYCLTVHHLDGDKSNCRWWNLLALCQRCHLQIQAKVVPSQGYMLEHTEWFKVYAAGFYAHVAEIEITREEAIASRDYWLWLGQPHLLDHFARSQK